MKNISKMAVKLPIFILLSILSGYSMRAFSQVNLLNFNFNSATSYPALPTDHELNISGAASSSETFTTNSNGTPTDGSAFITNSTGGSALEMANSSGSSKFFLFSVDGFYLKYYKSHKIYFQAKETSNGATILTLTFSTDGIDYGTESIINNIGSSYAPYVIDLSSYSRIDNAKKLYFKLTASNASGTGPLNIDNFQLQSTYTVNPIDYNQRGLYVDNFYLFLRDQNGDDIVDPIYSILGGGTYSSGLYSHERALLEYCSRNHITHLILYDLPNLFTTADYVLNSQGEQGDVSLCRFMTAAKNDYCIETFSAAVSEDLQADYIITQNIQFSPIILTTDEVTRIGNSALTNAIQSVDSLITDTIVKKDIDLLRFTVMMDRFNGPTGCPDFDFFATENEYWNIGLVEYNKWLALVNYIHLISSIPIEGYTFVFNIAGTSPPNPTDESIRDFYDGTTSTNRNIARTLATHYTCETDYIEESFDIWRTQEINYMLKDAGTPGHSIILPIFSAESADLSPIPVIGPPANFVGEWIIDPYTGDTDNGIDPVISRNIFSVEKYYYDDWRNNTDPDVLTNLSSPLENIIKPGSADWLNSSLMMKYFDHPTIFYRDGVYGCSSSNSTVTFNYCGPVDPGTQYTFTLTNTGFSRTTGLQILADITNDPYGTPHSVPLAPISFTNVPPSTAPYTATLQLDYVTNQGGACGSYTYSQQIYVSNNLKISCTGDIDPATHKMCEGSSATLFANFSDGNPNHIEWYLDGSATGHVGSFLKLPMTLSAGSHTYYYKVTSTPAPSCGTQSQSFIVIVNSNPKITPITFDCTGFPGQIFTASTYSSAAFLWSDGFTTASRVIPQSEYISVLVTNQGGCTRIIKTSLPSKPKLDITGTCSFTATVNPISSGASYSWFKFNPITNGWTPYGPPGTSISSLAPGKYGCKASYTVPTRCMFTTFIVGGAITSINQTNISCATGNVGAITIDVEGDTDPYSYSWSHCGTCLTGTVTGLLAGTYTCTVTDINNCASSVTMTITSSNPCQAQSLQICDGTNITSIFSFYTPGMTVAVHGELIINDDFTFNGSDITFDENSKITINPNKTLNIINACTLRVCPQFNRWQGIILSDGSSVLNVNGNSIIRDANQAILAVDGARLTIENNFFINNTNSITLQKGTALNGNFSTSLFQGNQFYSGNTDLTQENVISHIDLKNVSSVTIGDPGISSTRNLFSHSLYAIRSESSTSTIQNNEFFELGKMFQDDALNWVTSGAAIYAFGTNSHIVVGGSSSAQELNYFHDLTGAGIDIYEQYDVDINSNLFSSVYSCIQMNKVNAKIINVEYNEFNNFYAGISCFDVALSDLKFHDNKFNMRSVDVDPLISDPENYSSLSRYGRVAIDIQSVFPNALTLDCYHNWIANTNFGCHIRNIASTSMGAVVIHNNQIFFTMPASEIKLYDRGIWMEGSSNCKIANNHIRSLNFAPDCDFSKRMVGIEFSKSTQCLIDENYLGQMGRGIYGLNACMETRLHCNNMENFCDGIVCSKLNIPVQGTPGGLGTPSSSYDNEWNGSVGSLKIAGDVAFSILLDWYRLTTAPFTPVTEEDINVGNVSSAFNPSDATVRECTAPTVSSPMLFREEVYEKTAYGLSSYGTDALFHSYYEKILFYTGLKKDPSLLTLGTTDDIVYQTLYNSLDAGNIGNFEKVSDLIRNNDLASANILLNSLIDENIVEQYRKTVSQIFIDKEIGQRELTTSEKAALESIAYELGIYGGEAVYMARAMLKIFVDEDLTFARRSAPEFYTNKKNGANNVKSTFLFPNPANSEVSVILSGTKDKRLLVFNSLGSLVKSIELSKDLPIFTFNVESFEEGIYNVAISDENGITKTNKLVVIH